MAEKRKKHLFSRCFFFCTKQTNTTNEHNERKKQDVMFF
ncbi:hypothetical protein bthur0009_18200 [Bacillus thuringiensis serovar andalousiensis BGSC 4AW1]|nr:hypothetical protein bthur0009_18200 [Bacillus thuringiensis serovar andalousiensis BGSC 4AW1]EEM78020.1 hypothetical protein bthur0010_18330 [Bacillus thuringiensis serovar pondicheriensis BGSC 4BA1]